MNWKVFAVGSAIFAGLTAVLAKVGVERISATAATLIRVLVMAVFLGAVVFFRGEWQNPAHFPRRSVLFLILSGLAGGLSWLCYFRAMQLGPAAGVVALDKFSLPIAVLLAVVFLGEKLNMGQWAGVGVIFLGTLLLSLAKP